MRNKPTIMITRNELVITATKIVSLLQRRKKEQNSTASLRDDNIIASSLYCYETAPSPRPITHESPRQPDKNRFRHQSHGTRVHEDEDWEAVCTAPGPWHKCALNTWIAGWLKEEEEGLCLRSWARMDRMQRWMNGWMDGCIDGCIAVSCDKKKNREESEKGLLQSQYRANGGLCTPDSQSRGQSKND